MPHDAARFSVTVIASYKTSFETWRKAGILERELAYLKLLSERLGPAALITYEGVDQDVEATGGNIAVTGRKRFVPAFLYSLLAPVLHRNILRRTAAIRAYQLRGAWTAALASLIYRKPFVLRTGYVWSQFKKAGGGNRFAYRIVFLLERFALWRADLVITSSEADRRLLMELHGVPADRIHVIPNPIDTGLFRPDEDVVEQPGLVTYVGRLEPQKRVDLLIDAIRQVPGARLRIIGNGSLRESLERRADGLPVEFLGTIPNESLPELLAETAVFVLPSRFEGTPKALLEAMACGCAVVVTRSATKGQLVESGINGIVTDSDPDAIAAALSLLLGDAGLRAKLGSAVRESVREKYSMAIAAVNEAALIRSIEPDFESTDGETGSVRNTGKGQPQRFDKAA